MEFALEIIVSLYALPLLITTVLNLGPVYQKKKKKTTTTIKTQQQNLSNEHVNKCNMKHRDKQNNF